MNWPRPRLLRKSPLLGPLAALVLLFVTVGLVVTTSTRATHASAPLPPAPTHAPAQRTATCSEPARGGGTTTWTAKYESTTGKVGAGLRVTALGSNHTAGTAGTWSLWWVEPNNLAHQESASAANLARLTAPTTSAVLVPPTADCALVLTSTVPHHSIAVIGDSIFSSINQGLDSQRLAQSAFTSRLLVTAEGGYGWGASAPAWPLTTVRGEWALGLLRGLIPRSPRCVVVELGANDALRGTFTDARHDPRGSADIRRAAADNTAQFLATARSAGIHVVLVTVSEYPVKQYGAGVAFAREAALLNATIRSLTNSSRGSVVLADWAAVSAAHHAAHPAGQDWFINDDLHPNALGEQALLALVREATSRAGC